MNIKKFYLFLKEFPFVYVLLSSSLFLLIIFVTNRTHQKGETHYDLAYFKVKESNLNQLTSIELNEIRLLLISRIVDFSKILRKFKLKKSNFTVDVDSMPTGMLKIFKTIKKDSNLLEKDEPSLKLDLNNLEANYLDRIILEDAEIDKKSSTVHILIKLKKIQLKGKFSLCSKNSTLNCLDGEFEQLTNESLVSWSAKITVHEQLKFSLNDANFKNHLDQAKVLTKIKLNNVQSSNQFIDQVILEFIRPYLDEEFNKLINYEIGKTINSIYADLFEPKGDLIREKSSKTKQNSSYEQEAFNDSANNQSTVEIIRNLINLPSMISGVMYKFLEQSLNVKNSPKITFHNQNIEAILKTNLSTLQALKTKYLGTLKDHLENLDIYKVENNKQNLHAIAQPFFELIENQLRETIETKIDGLINTMMVNLNSNIAKHKTGHSKQEDANESNDSEKQSSDLINQAMAEFDHEVENVDHDEVLPENDEIEDEYTQTVRSQRKKRQVPCQRGQDLDEYVDSLFRFASRLVRAMEPVSLPNATVDLPEYNMKLFLHHGGATRAYTLQRKRPAWVYCTNESVSLGLTVGFEDIRVKYKYRAIKDWGLLFDGELEAKLEHAKLQVQFTQTTPEEDSDVPVMQRIDRIRIWRLGHVRVMLKGLGNFTQAVSMLLTRMLNQNIDQLSPTLRHIEGEVVQIGNNLLRNISIPFFSII